MSAKSNHGGYRPGSGRKRKATAQRYGEVWVRLSRVDSLSVLTNTNEIVLVCVHPNVYTPEIKRDHWSVNGEKFTDYAAAAAEFVRRVNESR